MLNQIPPAAGRYGSFYKDNNIADNTQKNKTIILIDKRIDSPIAITTNADKIDKFVKEREEKIEEKKSTGMLITGACTLLAAFAGAVTGCHYSKNATPVAIASGVAGLATGIFAAHMGVSKAREDINNKFIDENA